MKLWGAIFVAVGCGYMGFLMSLDLKERVKVTGEFIVALNYMSQEIMGLHRPLPLILTKLGGTSQVKVREYFQVLRERLYTSNEESFSVKWRDSFNKTGDLQQELVELLKPLGNILGQYEASRQGQAIDDIVGQLVRLKLRQEEEYRRLSKVYGVVGVSGGLFCVILLL